VPAATHRHVCPKTMGFLTSGCWRTAEPKMLDICRGGLTPPRATSRTGGNPRMLYASLPEARSGRWGADLTAAKMRECRWAKPVLSNGPVGHEHPKDQGMRLSLRGSRLRRRMREERQNGAAVNRRKNRSRPDPLDRSSPRQVREFSRLRGLRVKPGARPSRVAPHARCRGHTGGWSGRTRTCPCALC